MDKPEVIFGGRHIDARGIISFVNAFDMKDVKRCYYIIPSNDELRGWQGHQFESKWFYCIKGAFDVGLIGIKDWNSPSQDLDILKYTLTDVESNALYVPGGYVNAFRAIDKDSILVVYSDCSVEASGMDDYRFPQNHWEF